MTSESKTTFFGRVEDIVASSSLCLMILLLALKVLLKKIADIDIFVAPVIHHLVLWVALVGGMITSRQKRHIALGAGIEVFKGKARDWAASVVNALSVAVSAAITCASLGFVFTMLEPGLMVFFIPVQAVCSILPIGFAVITIRFFTSIKGGARRLIAGGIGLVAGILFGASPLTGFVIAAFSAVSGSESAIVAALSSFHDASAACLSPLLGSSVIPLSILIAASAFAGAPIFIVLAGIALFLFYGSTGVTEAVPDAIYLMLKGNLIPAIPLFTFAGFILSESSAGKRFVFLARALFGSFPGGHAIATVILCALFTTLTGGSGVTILALGALLLMILEKNGYGGRFSLGLLVSSGSSGLHFPPSLPLILYGVVTELDIKQLFVGGILPGTLLIAGLSGLGIWHAARNKVKSYPFSAARAVLFTRGAIWEILFPVLIIASYFSGFTPLVETSAIACVYAIVVYVFIKRDITLSDLPRVIVKSIPIIGGVLLLYACALAFKSYIIDAQLPTLLADWMSAVIRSKYVFLLLLNVALLLAGFFTESISAILVIAPLIVPLAAVYGIHPVHMAIIFIANLELGFLTPPFGMNLFLASYRFGKPVTAIYRSIVPFFFLMLAMVLMITYVPWLSTGLLGVIKF